MTSTGSEVCQKYLCIEILRPVISDNFRNKKGVKNIGKWDLLADFILFIFEMR